MKLPSSAFALTAALLLVGAIANLADGQTLRIVNYNVDADTGGSMGQMGGTDGGPGLASVLEAIGQEHLSNGNAQPIDVLALEELDYNGGSTPLTATFIANQLNTFYNVPGLYAADPTRDTTSSDGVTGNGPSGLVYNTHTVQVLNAQPIGTPSGSGEPRAPMRYKLKPLGGAAYSQFYMYVSHAKADSGTANASRRNTEAQNVRNDAATLKDFDALSYPHLLYTGDWNITGGSSEQTYLTLIAASPAPGQAMDPINPAHNWSNSGSTNKNLFTESATGISARFDLQLPNSAVAYENVSNNFTMPGLQLVPGTFTPFGNNGSIARNAAVTNGSNTALSDLTPSSYRSSILTALTTATDHLPVVADYSIVPPGDLNRDGHVNAADLTAMATALTNIPAYETSIGFTGLDKDNQMMEIGDVNGDMVFNNADLQALENFLISSGGTETAVPESASLLLFGLAMPVFVWMLGRRQRIVHA